VTLWEKHLYSLKRLAVAKMLLPPLSMCLAVMLLPTLRTVTLILPLSQGIISVLLLLLSAFVHLGFLSCTVTAAMVDCCLLYVFVIAIVAHQKLLLPSLLHKSVLIALDHKKL